MHNRGSVITLVGKKLMDAGEIVVSGSISGGVNLKIVGEDMEVDDCVEQKVNGAVEEVLSDGIAVVENGNGSIPVQESMVVKGTGQALEGDSDSKFLLNMEKGSSDLVREEEYSDAEVVGNHTAVENAVESATENDERVALSVTELVAKARAPMKSEFLTTAVVRVLVPNGTVTGQGSTNGAWDEKKESRVVPEKKLKRQMKRERLQTVTTRARELGFSWLHLSTGARSI